MYAINPDGSLKWSKMVSDSAFILCKSPVINLQGNVIKVLLTSDYLTKFGSNLYSFS